MADEERLSRTALPACYVYYQMNRPDEAKKSIDAAYAQMPDAPAVRTLKDAIYATQK